MPEISSSYDDLEATYRRYRNAMIDLPSKELLCRICDELYDPFYDKFYDELYDSSGRRKTVTNAAPDDGP